MAIVKHNKIKLREVNRHLVCRLCRGYYIDATTIAECLHSFCRSCIIKYLEKNSFCPICEVQIHKTKPYLNLRLDKALQDVVYKLVPGLYHDEMKRRREFYAKHQEQIPVTTPEQCGLEERIIFSPDDSISLSLEYLESDDYETDTVSSQSSESGDNPESLSFPQQLGLMKLKTPNDGKSSRRESQDIQESSFPKRYLQCPAVVSVCHLKKFIRMKHDLTDRMQVDIIHKRVPLPDHYTLMDVAYIYTWKRSAPMRFFYQICETKRQKMKLAPTFIKADEPRSVLTNGLDKSTKEVDSTPKVEKESLTNGESVESEPNRLAAVAKDVKGELVPANKTVRSDVKQSVNVSVKCADNKVKQGVVEKNTVDSKDKVNGLDSQTTKDKSSGGKPVDMPVRDKNKVEKSEKGSDAKLTKGDKSKVPTVAPTTAVTSKPLVNGQSKDSRNERLLLNPISGQLESVPSAIANRGKLEATGHSSDKKDHSADSVKKTATAAADHKGRKPALSEGQKEVKKSNMNLLKSFRKEKVPVKESKSEGVAKVGTENSLTITAVSKFEKQTAGEKEKANVSIEIKSEKKESEYDFDGTSPPSKIIPLQEYSKMTKSQKFGSSSATSEKPTQNSWMSLQDFRMQMLKESNGAATTPGSVGSSTPGNDDPGKKDKRKSVPSLFRIGADGNKKSSPKTPNGNSLGDKTKQKKMSPTIINIKTENLDSSKTEIKIELPVAEGETPPKPLKMESKGGESATKQGEEDPKKSPVLQQSVKSPTDGKNGEDVKTDSDKQKESSPKEAVKRASSEKPEVENPKKSKPASFDGKDNCGAIDLSKTETSPKSVKNPLENLMDLANKSGTQKSDENMVEALISAAQKQSIEPLLKIPQYSQNQKNSSSQGSPPLNKSISSNDISQALQFFKDLRSDIKVLEAKSQLSPNSFLEQFAQKSTNLEPIQLYQQHIDLIRRLKRQQQLSSNETDTPQRKQGKLSPTSESKRKSSPESTRITEEAVQLKSSLERTLSQIQDQMELQSRMVAAQNYKNLPALLQFYNRPPAFCPSPPSPSKLKIKSSSRSPSNSQKSPNSRTSPPGPQGTPLPLAIANPEASFFSAQKYNHLINAGLNSEMTFHQMFQNYLNQQDKMNQIKHSTQALAKKPQGLAAPKTLPDLYFGSSQGGPKKQDCNSVGAVQKT